jgi:hypothetical protein
LPEPETTRRIQLAVDEPRYVKTEGLMAKIYIVTEGKLLFETGSDQEALAKGIEELKRTGKGAIRISGGDHDWSLEVKGKAIVKRVFGNSEEVARLDEE